MTPQTATMTVPGTAFETGDNPDLKDLLNIMRRMHVAAATGNWEVVDALDGERQEFLYSLTACPDLNDQRNSSIICEIVDLDQAVIGIASASLAMIADAVLTNC